MNDRHSETIRHDEIGSVMLKRYRVKMINHELITYYIARH
ncbi:hypothetical protein UUU_34960 [Klebsiella pneumoniae subsp. pneumoniae DSM 30104 = JCM 1662 = NBRC 14940]|nr:hypothetical protein UUU_34960 [Klebsiella pneumoniae subsp. pneumoniae DSM 30104 = JCM 1662 = NBRC 14940]ESB02482.1 hypothetical protein HMPREF1619_01356 [Klebsiella pneumoniae 909957]